MDCSTPGLPVHQLGYNKRKTRITHQTLTEYIPTPVPLSQIPTTAQLYTKPGQVWGREDKVEGNGN